MAKNPNEKLLQIYKIESNNAKKILRYADQSLLKVYRNSLKEIQAQITELYAGEILPIASQMAKYERLTKLEGFIAQEIKQMTNETIKIQSTAILDQYQHANYMMGYAHENALNMRMGFGLLNKNTVLAAKFNPVDAIKWNERVIDNANLLNKHIREAVTQGLVQGEAFSETVKRLGRDDLKKQFMPEVKKNIKRSLEKNLYESTRIIRTESMRARQAGKLLGYDKVRKAADETGVEIKRMWVSVVGLNTRPDHAAMDTQEEDESGYFRFPISGGRTQAPGLSGIAKQDINCRCDVITKFIDIPYKVRRENIGEKDIIDFTSFESWAKEKGITKNAYGQKYNFY